MKNIRTSLMELLKSGYCAPRIANLAAKLKEPSTTIHYNLRQMEKDGIIKTYKAVLDYKRVDEGLCSFVLVNLSPDEYTDPERIAKSLAKLGNIESVDMLSGEWDMLIKVRTKDTDEYYQFVRRVLQQKGVAKINTLNSLKQIKTEFVEV